IYVNQPPAASVTVDASYCQDSFMSIAIQASDPEDGELVLSIDPSGDPLPDDLSLDPATGLISGVLAQTGTSSTYNIVVRVTDPEDASTTVPVTINSDDCTTGLRIVSLILINSITDVEVMALSNGQQIHIDD